MIIWSGLGFLGLLLPVAGYIVIVKFLQFALGSQYTDVHSWPGALGTILGAAGVWFLGLKLSGSGRTLLDPATGQTVQVRKRHTLFWIPLQYVAIPMLLAGVGMLILKHGSPL